MEYRTGTWPIGEAPQVKFSKWGSMKAMRGYMISEGWIKAEDWKRFAEGAEIERLDRPGYMIALAHTRDRYFPCFYY